MWLPIERDVDVYSVVIGGSGWHLDNCSWCRGPYSFNYLRSQPIKPRFNQVLKSIKLLPQRIEIFLNSPRIRFMSPESKIWFLTTACGQNFKSAGRCSGQDCFDRDYYNCFQKNDTIGRSVLESVILNRTHYKKTKEGCRGLAAVVVSSFAVGMWCASRNTPLE